jgi:hypothetical protein
MIGVLVLWVVLQVWILLASAYLPERFHTGSEMETHVMDTNEPTYGWTKRLPGSRSTRRAPSRPRR